jgi:Glyoxalase/Bleomycin resistance protein/Dioxygenase superfamily
MIPILCRNARYRATTPINSFHLMDHGWIATLGSQHQMTVQISVATEGGSGTSAPDLSIEVDELDAALRAMKATGFPIEYGPVDEPWGVRRFYVRDPFGKIVNILPIAIRRETRALQCQWRQWQAFRASSVAPPGSFPEAGPCCPLWPREKTMALRFLRPTRVLFSKTSK